MLNKLLVTFALVLGGTGAAQAAETFYTTRAAFDAATTGQTVDTFGTAAGSNYVGPTYVRSGYQIAANDAWLFNNNATYDPQGWYNWGSGNVLTAKQNSVITITFNAPVTAFGIDLGTVFQNYPAAPTFAYSVGVAAPSSELNIVTGPTQNLTFFGFTSTSAFSSITFYGGANNFTILDNVTLATANATAAVPETATWMMMILGFGLIGAGLRSRRTTVAFAA